MTRELVIRLGLTMAFAMVALWPLRPRYIVTVSSVWASDPDPSGNVFMTTVSTAYQWPEREQIVTRVFFSAQSLTLWHQYTRRGNRDSIPPCLTFSSSASAS